MAETKAVESSKQTRKWYQWYSPEDTPEERRFLLKLDLLILPIALLSFWIKNMDYSNISMSGPKSPPSKLYFDSLKLMPCRQCLCFRNERRAGILRQ